MAQASRLCPSNLQRLADQAILIFILHYESQVEDTRQY